MVWRECGWNFEGGWRAMRVLDLSALCQVALYHLLLGLAVEPILMKIREPFS